jgi:hypothetical protein
MVTQPTFGFVHKQLKPNKKNKGSHACRYLTKIGPTMAAHQQRIRSGNQGVGRKESRPTTATTCYLFPQKFSFQFDVLCCCGAGCGMAVKSHAPPRPSQKSGRTQLQLVRQKTAICVGNLFLHPGAVCRNDCYSFAWLFLSFVIFCARRFLPFHLLSFFFQTFSCRVGFTRPSPKGK